MMTEKHLDELGSVLVINAAGWLPTIAGFEEVVRITGLILAAIYTSLKIWEILRKK